MLTQNRQMELMRKVIELARTAGEHPFAALLVNDEGEIIASAINQQEQTHDRTAHAEVGLIREASMKLKTLYLNDYSIVSVSEPCSMCMSLIVKAKIKAVYYGAPLDQSNDPLIYAEEIVARSKHKVELYPGILKQECIEVIAPKRGTAF